MSGRERILAAALNELRRNGSVGFRIDAVLAETGLSVGNVYHHFKNRDGLLRAAFLQVLQEVVEYDTAVLEELERRSTSVDDVLAGLRQLTVVTQQPERRDLRWLRVEAMAVARHDPELWEAFGAIVRETADRHAAAFQRFKDRGWLRAEVDPYLLFLSISGNTMATTQADIGHGPVDVEAWAEHTMALFTAYVRPAD